MYVVSVGGKKKETRQMFSFFVSFSVDGGEVFGSCPIGYCALVATRRAPREDLNLATSRWAERYLFLHLFFVLFCFFSLCVFRFFFFFWSRFHFCCASRKARSLTDRERGGFKKIKETTWLTKKSLQQTVGASNCWNCERVKDKQLTIATAQQQPRRSQYQKKKKSNQNVQVRH